MTYLPSMVLCDRQLTGTGSSVTLTNIPASGYANLILRGSARTDEATALGTLGLFFNNDMTTSNYRVRDNPGGGQTTAGNYIVCNGNGATSGYFGTFNSTTFQYATSGIRKSSITDSVLIATSAEVYWYSRGQSWNSTAAITRVDITTLGSAVFITGGWVELWVSM